MQALQYSTWQHGVEENMLFFEEMSSYENSYTKLKAYCYQMKLAKLDSCKKLKEDEKKLLSLIICYI